MPEEPEYFITNHYTFEIEFDSIKLDKELNIIITGNVLYDKKNIKIEYSLSTQKHIDFFNLLNIAKPCDNNVTLHLQFYTTEQEILTYNSTMKKVKVSHCKISANSENDIVVHDNSIINCHKIIPDGTYVTIILKYSEDDDCYYMSFEKLLPTCIKPREIVDEKKVKIQEPEIKENSLKINGSGSRFNENKLRYDLLPVNALTHVSKVFEFGAKKYGEYNWRKGMSWNSVVASIERHLAAFKLGEDYDKESGLLHISHLVTNGLFLLDYYRYYPQGDDRTHEYLINNKRIGLDIDDVLADFIGGYCEYNNITELPVHWSFFHKGEKYKLEHLTKDFWLNLKPKVDPKEINFNLTCYITHRNIPVEWTIEWLERHNFPEAPVYMVEPEKTKVHVAKEQRLDVFVDDKFETFREMNNNGIFCWLFDTVQNRKHNVGFRRIYNLENVQ